jgi:hypothetical protein
VEPGIEAPPDVGVTPEADSAVPQAPERHWERLAWTGEFLLATAVAAIVWSEAGGQVHLDMMPWYLKLAPLLAFGWSTVRYTMALVEQPSAWGVRSVRWLAAMLSLGVAMFAITLYYHLHEPVDDTDEDEGVSTSMHQPVLTEWRRTNA